MPSDLIIIALDGPSGSGKTTASDYLRESLGATIVHMDHLYDGWDGLEAGATQAAELVANLRSTGSGAYASFDWVASAYTSRVVVEPDGGLVVLEGVGSGTSAELDAVVWLDAPASERRERAIARGDFAGQWDRWAGHEAVHFAVHQTQSRADLELKDRPVTEVNEAVRELVNQLQQVQI